MYINCTRLYVLKDCGKLMKFELSNLNFFKYLTFFKSRKCQGQAFPWVIRSLKIGNKVI